MKPKLVEYLESKGWKLDSIYPNNTMVFLYPSTTEWSREMMYNLDSNKMKMVNVYTPDEAAVEAMGYTPRKNTIFDGWIRSLEDYIIIEKMLFY